MVAEGGSVGEWGERNSPPDLDDKGRESGKGGFTKETQRKHTTRPDKQKRKGPRREGNYRMRH